MTSAISLSQNMKIKDSITISLHALDFMIKDIKKCDSVKVALIKKDTLITELTKNNLEMFSNFSNERNKKKQAIKERDKAQQKLNSFKRKKFNLGLSVGPVIYTTNESFSFKPAVLIGLNYSIFSF